MLQHMRFNPDRENGDDRARARARELRRAMTIPEVKLWKRLRDRRMGVKFRRQHPIGPYTADFYAPDLKLVIELDGARHDSVHDAARDAYMRDQGIVVVRIAVWRLEQDFDHYVASLAERVRWMRSAKQWPAAPPSPHADTERHPSIREVRGG